MSKQSVNLKGELELGKVTSHLEEIINGLTEGTLCIQQGTDLVTLKPTAYVDMDLEASAKGNKEKLTIELSWKQEAPKESPDEEFKISSTEPETIEEPVTAE